MIAALRLIPRLFACAFVLASLTAQQPSTCLFQQGSYVKIESPGGYAEALLWNSRAKLESFLRDEYDGYEVYRFTVVVVPPDAHAVVESACPAGNRHIIGVRVRSGPLRGRFGWLDVHDARP